MSMLDTIRKLHKPYSADEIRAALTAAGHAECDPANPTPGFIVHQIEGHTYVTFAPCEPHFHWSDMFRDIRLLEYIEILRAAGLQCTLGSRIGVHSIEVHGLTETQT